MHNSENQQRASLASGKWLLLAIFVITVELVALAPFLYYFKGYHTYGAKAIIVRYSLLMGLMALTIVGLFLHFTTKQKGGRGLKAITLTSRVLAIAVFLLNAFLIPMPSVERAREGQGSTYCIFNAKRIALALLSYADEHDGRLPEASRWVEELKQSKSASKEIDDWQAVLRCPSDKSTAKVSYAMNSALSGKRLKDINLPERIVLLFDTSSSSPNPHGGFEALAKPPRHLGNVVAFADATVKRFYIEDGKKSLGPADFAPQ